MQDWREDLGDFFKKKENKKEQDETKLMQTKREVDSFYSTKVTPAFDELKTELEKYGREASVYAGVDYSSVTVKYEGSEEFCYAIKVRIRPGFGFPYPEYSYTDKKTGKRHTFEGFIHSGSQDYDVSGVSKDEIIRDFLFKYKMHVGWYDRNVLKILSIPVCL